MYNCCLTVIQNQIYIKTHIHNPLATKIRWLVAFCRQDTSSHFFQVDGSSFFSSFRECVPEECSKNCIKYSSCLTKLLVLLQTTRIYTRIFQFEPSAEQNTTMIWLLARCRQYSSSQFFQVVLAFSSFRECVSEYVRFLPDHPDRRRAQRNQLSWLSWKSARCIF